MKNWSLIYFRLPKVYESITDAAADCNIRSCLISRCCLKIRRSTGNYFWMFYDEYKTKGFDFDLLEPKIRKNSLIYKRVKQYDMNLNFIKLWDSVKQVNEKCSFNMDSIIAVCLGKRNTSNGYYWSFENDAPVFKKHNAIKRNINQIHPVTDEIIKTFSSLKEAVNELNINGNHIGCACKGLRKTCGGYKWAYAVNH